MIRKIAALAAALVITTATPAMATTRGEPGWGRYGPARCAPGRYFHPVSCPIDQYRGDFSPTEIEALIRRVFTETPDRAVRIARCESVFDVPALWHGRYALSDSHDVGVFQINRAAWGTRLMDGRWVVTARPDWEFDPMMHEVGPNLVMARLVYDTAGRSWRPWGCSKWY